MYMLKNRLHNGTSVWIIITKHRSRDLIAGYGNGVNGWSVEESVNTTSGIGTVGIGVIVVGHIRWIFIERRKVAIT